MLYTRSSTIQKEFQCRNVEKVSFRVSLLCAHIHVFTDPKNLTHAMTSFATQRVLRGASALRNSIQNSITSRAPKNTVADVLSRVPTKLTLPLLKEKSPKNSQLKYSDVNANSSRPNIQRFSCKQGRLRRTPIEDAEMAFHAEINFSPLFAREATANGLLPLISNVRR
jgi:hypothetical protein